MKDKSVLPKVKTNLKAGGWWDDVKKKSGSAWASAKQGMKNLNDQMKA